jgi:acetyltransferase-like isoleucine patch superfamily enzyme
MILEPHYIDVGKRIFIRFLTSIIARIKSRWWGVKTGTNLKVFGKIYYRRYPDSKIVIGDNCRFNSSTYSNLIGINHPCLLSTLSPGSSIIIGDNCGFSGVAIGAHKAIVLGNNICCGANVLITDTDWHLDDPRSGIPKEVLISDNVWLGEGVKVLKGVTIGKNSIIGAGSIVVKDIPENVVAAGNPCKVITLINE